LNGTPAPSSEDHPGWRSLWCFDQPAAGPSIPRLLLLFLSHNTRYLSGQLVAIGTLRDA
jgi:hypothetical protein